MNERIERFVGSLQPHECLALLEEAWSAALDSQKAGFVVSHRDELAELLDLNPE